MSGRRILASGAVIAWEARGLKTQAFLNRASRNGFLIALPAIVIAETTRGGARAAAMNCVITPVTAVIARKAGELLAAAGNRNATVDALIVAEAVLGGAFTLLTGDVDDLSALANGYPASASTASNPDVARGMRGGAQESDGTDAKRPALVAARLATHDTRTGGAPWTSC